MVRIGRQRHSADPPRGDQAWDDRRMRKRRRRRRVLVVGLLLAATIAALAPTVVGLSPLKDVVLGRALSAEAGRVTCASAGFGWIAGQSLAGVRLVDPEGNLLAEADAVSVDRSLWGLLTNRDVLGRIVVERPVIYLKTRSAGSNWEDFLARLPSDPDEPTPSMRVEVVDGMVRGEDQASGELWQADDLNLEFGHDAGAWQGHGAAIVAMPGDASAAMAEQDELASKTHGALQARFDSASEATSRGHPFEIVADRVPLKPLQPWLERIVAGARLEGNVSLDVKGRAGVAADGAVRASSAGKIEFADARATADQLAPDALELRDGWVALDAELDQGRLEVRRLEAQGDWLQATGSGSADWDAVRRGDASWLADADATIDCKLDVAEITRMLPRTLGLRAGVRVDAGAVEASIRNQRDGDVNTWTAGLSAKHIHGADGEREIRWDQPVEASAVLETPAAGPQLRQASIASPFANGSVTPEADGYRGQLQFDLQRLVQQAGQFIDLSQWRIRGSGDAKFALVKIADNRYRATGEAALQQLDVRRGGEILWNDPQLNVELDAIGQASSGQLENISSALVDLIGPSESLTVELLEPYEPAADSDQWYFRIEGNGPLAAWAQRVSPFVAHPPDEVAGRGSLSARVRLTPEFIEALSIRLLANGLTLRQGERKLQEDRLELTGGFRWDKIASRFVSKQVEFTSTTVAARGSELALEFGGPGVPSLRGELAFRADLERLVVLLGLPRVEGALLPQGQTVGQLRLSSDEESAVVQLTSTTQPLHLMRVAKIDPTEPPRAIPVWNEPQLEASGTLSYDRAADQLQIDQLQLVGATMQVSGTARVDQLSGAAALHGELDVQADQQAAAEFIASYLPPTIRIEGLNQAQLTIDGPLAAAAADDSATQSPTAHWSRRWRIDGNSGWTSADVFGMPIGSGLLLAALTDGKLSLEPLSVQAGQGRVNAHCRVLLNPGPAELQLASGELVSNVRITPEVAENALKYAAPILAGTTLTEGTFSLETSGLRLPLGDPQRAESRGKLTIHQLSIAPGPMLQELGRSLRQIEAVVDRSSAPGGAPDPTSVRTITAVDRVVDVSVFRGRVHHRNLEFQVDGVPVRSSGSVGFDESLDLMIEFAIPEKWFRQDRLKRLFAGEMMQIPIKGSFDSPRVDSQAALNRVLEIGQGAIGRAAEEIIGDELNRALDRLLRPR